MSAPAPSARGCPQTAGSGMTSGGQRAGTPHSQPGMHDGHQEPSQELLLVPFVPGRQWTEGSSLASIRDWMKAEHRKGPPRAHPHATHPFGPLLSPAADWVTRCQHCTGRRAGDCHALWHTGLTARRAVHPHPPQGPGLPGAHSLLAVHRFSTLHQTACLTS